MTPWFVSLLVAASAAQPRPDLPEAVHRALGPQDVSVAMTDGTRLWTRLWLPDVAGPVPTVLIRSPYDKAASLVDRSCRVLAGQGYACVNQLVRGRGDSGGAWVPFVHERADGLDTIRWVREQPWSDGKLAMMGDSYLAGAAWAVLGDAPEGLVTVVSRVFGPSTWEGMYDDGLFRHELATAWMTLMPAQSMRFFSAGRYHRALDHRPRTTMDLVAAGFEVPWFRDWLAADRPTDPYWARPEVAAFDATPTKAQIPLLMVGGWADTFVGPTFTAWDRLASQGQSLLVVGPWEHLGRVASDVPLGSVAGGLGGDGTLQQGPRVLSWLDHHLRGGPAPEVRSGTLTYVVGGARWEHAAIWPPASTPTTWWLAASEDRCTGTLTTAPPPRKAWTYTYDPADPVRASGDAAMLAGSLPFFFGVKPGFRRQREHCEDRPDLLAFQSTALPTSTRIAGRISASLDVRSDAADTAFVVRVVEVHADGVRILVREDLATIGFAQPPGVPYVPGARTTLHLETLPVDYVFQRGSRIEVVVTSSSYPRIDAHPNVAGSANAAEATVVARNTVELGTSHIVLPSLDEAHALAVAIPASGR